MFSEDVDAGLQRMADDPEFLRREAARHEDEQPTPPAKRRWWQRGTMSR